MYLIKEGNSLDLVEVANHRGNEYLMYSLELCFFFDIGLNSELVTPG
jgi:hypothetical protein